MLLQGIYQMFDELIDVAVVRKFTKSLAECYQQTYCNRG